jgi:FSR family fosmidomycin resistance protein-like MFS transporter
MRLKIAGALHLPYKSVPAIYGIIHALVDASTIGLLFGILGFHSFDAEKRYYLILLYNFLAFGGQPVFGIITDWLKAPKITTLAGIAAVAFSFLFFFTDPVLAIVLASIGNGLFHVGGGVISFFVTPKRALAPGIFVAPGALGLGIGLFLGKNDLFTMWPLALLLFISALAVLIIKTPETYKDAEKIRIDADWPYLVLPLLFISIFFRALIGSTGGYTIEKSLLSLVVLSGVAFGGKALGGFISDKLGWLKTSVLALLISCPLIAFTGGNLIVGATGMLFFQMTMPVTLTATAGVIPKNPGLAFGLNCLALFFGVLIGFFPLKFLFYNPLWQAVSILIAATVVFLGLFFLNKRSIWDKKLY